MSASQLKQTSCMRRWGAARLAGIKEPTGDAALRGVAHHAEMERWAKHGEVPTTRPALSALKYAPAPGLAEVEVAARFDYQDAPFLGYIDLAYDWDGKHPAKIGSTGWTVIHDWKFTGSLRNAKVPEDLLHDEAVNIYAQEAFLGGAERVSGRWVYVQMNGSCPAREVWFDIERRDVAFRMDVLTSQNKTLQKHYADYKRGLLKIVDLPQDTAQCYAFRQQCPVMDTEYCNPKKSFSMSGAIVMNTDFRTSITASFPALPPSALRGAPPLPPHLARVIAPEAGFINPPEAPKVAAASPEHAAILQGILPFADAAPATPAPEDVDDLSGLNRVQLKALAVQIGAVPTNSRAGEDALRYAIRTARTLVVPRDLVPAATLPAAVEVVKPVTFNASIVDVSRALYEHEAATAKALPPLIDKSGSKTFTLFINCSPLRNMIGELEVSRLVSYANARLGVDDYRLVEYGKGPAGLCGFIKEGIETGEFGAFSYIVIDTRTPEGSTLAVTLSALADDVVRGF